MTGFIIKMIDRNAEYYVLSFRPWTTFGSADEAREFATRGGARNAIKRLQADDRNWPARTHTYEIVKPA